MIRPYRWITTTAMSELHRKAKIPRKQFPRSILVTSSRGCRACRRVCHEDATRKLPPWNSSLMEEQSDAVERRVIVFQHISCMVQ